MRFLSVAMLASAWLALVTISSPAAAASPVGTTISARGGASASGPDGTRSLADGGPVYLGDTVDTGLFGQVEIEFSDHTKLAMGPRSTMLIDDYVVRSPGRLNSFGLTAARGAFRFLTGDSAKQAYQIKTPTATIGIRGTEFDFAVARLRATAVALYGGSTRVCRRASRACADLVAACDVALIDTSSTTRTVSVALTDQQLRQAFPFMDDEARLSTALRVGSRRCAGGSGASGPNRGAADHEHSAPSGGDGDGEGNY